jgi:hypothetical protein
MLSEQDALKLATTIDPERSEELRKSLGERAGQALGVLLGSAFPALTPVHGWQAQALASLYERGLGAPAAYAPLMLGLAQPAEALGSSDFAAR